MLTRHHTTPAMPLPPALTAAITPPPLGIQSAPPLGDKPRRWRLARPHRPPPVPPHLVGAPYPMAGSLVEKSDNRLLPLFQAQSRFALGAHASDSRRAARLGPPSPPAPANSGYSAGASPPRSSLCSSPPPPPATSLPPPGAPPPAHVPRDGRSREKAWRGERPENTSASLCSTASTPCSPCGVPAAPVLFSPY